MRLAFIMAPCIAFASPPFGSAERGRTPFERTKRLCYAKKCKKVNLNCPKTKGDFYDKIKS